MCVCMRDFQGYSLAVECQPSCLVWRCVLWGFSSWKDESNWTAGREKEPKVTRGERCMRNFCNPSWGNECGKEGELKGAGVVGGVKKHINSPGI